MEKLNTAANPAANVSQSLEPVVLDIRPIFAQGASPCGHIDDAVAGLRPRQSLLLLAPFEPIPLFTKLAAQGFDHESQELPDGSWQIRFTRSRETVASGPAPRCCC